MTKFPFRFWQRLAPAVARTDSANEEGHTLPADFDAEFYLEVNSDVAAAGHDPRQHYLQYGRRESRPYSRKSSREIRYSSKQSASLVDRVMHDIDGDAVFMDVFARARAFTMTPKERLYALYEACRYVTRAGIAGDFVECGVWKGGSSICAALSLEHFAGKNHGRKLFLYDTFEGMTMPTRVDVDASGVAAQTYMARYGDNGRWVYAEEKEVRSNFAKAEVTDSEIVIVRGDVLNTIPARVPDQIAICRLDTDWYESTAHELSHLYPRLTPGGVLIIDDYGEWAGARAAVNEYFDGQPAALLVRVDSSARLLVKPNSPCASMTTSN
jgi:O-methyltransferase